MRFSQMVHKIETHLYSIKLCYQQFTKIINLIVEIIICSFWIYQFRDCYSILN